MPSADRKRSPVALLAAGLVACAAPPSPPLLAPGRGVEPPLEILGGPEGATAAGPRERVVATARRFLGGAPLASHGLTFDRDPVGFVRAALWEVEIDLVTAAPAATEGLAALYRALAAQQALHRETPRPGDLVFWDADARRTALDPAAVAIVEAVTASGRITALGWFAEGPARVVMNLRAGAAPADNTPFGEGSAVELFRTFADPWR